MSYTVAIIEDVAMHSIGIEGSVAMSGNKVGRTFINSQKFFRRYKELESEIDILMVDINLSRSQSDMNGFEIIRRLAKEQYDAKLVIVTDKEDFSNIKEAKKHGADGFVGKNVEPEYLSIFFDRLIASDEFIVAYPTLKDVFSHLLDLDIVKNKQPSFPKQLKDMIIALYNGQKTDEIIESIFRQELNEKILTYNSSHKIAPDKILEEIRKEPDCTDETVRQITDIINQDIDNIMKLEKIFAIKRCYKKLEVYMKTYKKLKDNMMTTIKLDVVGRLKLPNSKKQTIIAGAIFAGVLTEKDLFLKKDTAEMIKYS